MINLKYIIYIILGLIQGITEPLPVSSSGHLSLFMNIFNIGKIDTSFLIISNFASFLAILFIFRKDIIKLIKDFLFYILKKDNKIYKPSFKYVMCIIIATIPISISGLLFKSKLENLTNPKILAISFMLTAVFLFVVKNIKGVKKDNDITYKDALFIGFIEMFTIIPGLSRSGTVLVACLLRNLKKETALKFTFMLYFPVSIASFILEVFLLFNNGISRFLIFPYLIGFLVTTITTYYSYLWLSKIVKDGKLIKFSIYTLLLAIFIFIYFR